MRTPAISISLFSMLLALACLGCSSGDNNGQCADFCENGGTCDVVADEPVCECLGGFTGPQCEMISCASNPCENGGTCSVESGVDTCFCEDGYSGEFCEIAMGLESRPDNPSCVAPARAPNTGPLSWATASWAGLGGLMMIAQAPDDSWFEIYRGGEVYRVTSSGIRSSAPLVTIPTTTVGEMGLLGLAIHPSFPTEPYVFFYYASMGATGAVHIDRYTVAPTSGGAETVQFATDSRKEVFTYDRGNGATNHVGGSIQFDPISSDPILYLAMGDAAQANEAQSDASLLGKLLRFDLSDSDALSYTPEVVAKGLRNPYRWTFDRETGDLWIGDVGESTFEEVNRVPYADIPQTGPSTLNFGWPVMEAFSCLQAGDPLDSCGNPAPLTLPVHAYGRSLGVSVVSGYVYRGSAIAGLAGTYFFHDYFPQGGEPAWRLDANPTEVPSNLQDDYNRTEIPGNGGFASYAEDNAGELYAVSLNGGIFRLEAQQVGPPVEVMPALLSGSPCFDNSGEPIDAMIPYDVTAPLWSDGASKRRWLALPNDTTIDLDERGDFLFPRGTVLAKEFSVGATRVETRLFIRHPDGAWGGFSYAWIGEDGSLLSDAERLGDASVTRSIPSAGSWTYPSRGQCLSCHTSQTGFSLGLEAMQLDSEMLYAQTNREANQLQSLDSVGFFTADATSWVGQGMPAYDDTEASVADKAWSYLHSNCAGCHQPGGPGFVGRSTMPDLRYQSLASREGTEHPLTGLLCNIVGGAGDLGLGEGALLVEPGSPGNWDDLGADGSLLYLRMSARPDLAGTTGTMPQLGTSLVDEVDGLPLVSQWITELVCP